MPVVEMKNPNGQEFNVETAQVPRMIELGWSHIDEHPEGCTCPDCCEEGNYLWVDGEYVYYNSQDD